MFFSVKSVQKCLFKFEKHYICGLNNNDTDEKDYLRVISFVSFMCL